MISLRRSRLLLAWVCVVALAAACGHMASRSARPSTGSAATGSAATGSAATGSAATAGTGTTPRGVVTSTPASAFAERGVPHFRHVVVVVLENHSASDVYGRADAPFLNRLGRSGLRLTNVHAITHPSQPNYVALFAGSTLGVTDDACPQQLSGPTLASQLASVHRRFTGYAEGLPHAGYTGCSYGSYARKHNPWSDFASVPPVDNQPFTAFPRRFAQLPDVAFVVPDLEHDMHDGTVGQADTWLRTELAAYAAWTLTHDSLLMITWDESSGDSATDQIPTILYGADVSPGTDHTRATTYTLLRTVEAAFGLPGINAARGVAPLRGDWVP